MKLISLLMSFVFYAFSNQAFAVQKAFTCSQVLQNVSEPLKARSFVNSTIVGVVTTPQSLLGTTLGVMSTVLMNINELERLYLIELQKRDIIPYELNPELQRLVLAANNHHSPERVTDITELARLVTLEDLLETNPSNLRRDPNPNLDSKMRDRFIEIYNHGLLTMMSSLNQFQSVLTRNQFRVRSVDYNQVLLPRETGSSQTNFLRKISELDSEISQTSGLSEKLEVIGRVADRYFREVFIKYKSEFQKSLLEIVQRFPERGSKERDRAMLDRETHMSYKVVFDLYERLRHHLGASEAFQSALILTENYFAQPLPGSQKQQTNVSSTKPAAGGLLARRASILGFDDPVLIEITKAMIEDEVVIKLVNQYQLRSPDSSYGKSKIERGEYLGHKEEVISAVVEWLQAFKFNSLRPHIPVKEILNPPENLVGRTALDGLFQDFESGISIMDLSFEVSDEFALFILRDMIFDPAKKE